MGQILDPSFFQVSPLFEQILSVHFSHRKKLQNDKNIIIIAEL